MDLPYDALWRDDLDALQFVFEPDRFCMIHRLAFRTLVGDEADQVSCTAFFAKNSEAFLQAALAKAARSASATGNIHVNSRDVARMLNAPRLT